MAKHLHVHLHDYRCRARDEEVDIRYKGYRILGDTGSVELYNGGRMVDTFRSVELAKQYVDKVVGTTDSKRIIHAASQGVWSVKVYYDTDFSEFNVRLFRNGSPTQGDGYFTNERADAIGTAAAMLRGAMERRAA